MVIRDVLRPSVGTVVPGAVTTLLLGEGRFLRDTKALVERYIAALRDDGSPIDRLFIVFPTLHPQARAVSYVWNSDGRPTEEIIRAWTLGDAFLRSPIARMYFGTHDVIRRRLCDSSTPRDFEVLTEIEQQGFTDYLAVAMHGSGGIAQPTVISFATRAAGGFTDDTLHRVLSSLDLLAPLIDTHVAERIAEALLGVYLGPGAGARVLRGAVKRGDGENIPAAICFADLRDFTSMSDRLPRDVLLELLNTYFDCVVGAVQTNGGEVLKFIGDAVLTVFRADEGAQGEAARAALTAAKDAFARAASVNVARAAEQKPLVDFGMSIHVGEVMYGNIGGPDRLDFTVIGPAVNVASRIQGLCRSLSRTLLVSEQFVRSAGSDAEDLGEHLLKGVAHPIRLYAPR